MRRTTSLGFVLLGVAVAHVGLAYHVEAKERLSLSSWVGRILKLKKSEPVAREVELEQVTAAPPAANERPQGQGAATPEKTTTDQVRRLPETQQRPAPLPYPPLPPAVDLAWIKPTEPPKEQPYSIDDIRALTRTLEPGDSGRRGRFLAPAMVDYAPEFADFNPANSPVFATAPLPTSPVRQINHEMDFAAPPLISLPTENNVPLGSAPKLAAASSRNQPFPVTESPIEAVPVEALRFEEPAVVETLIEDPPVASIEPSSIEPSPIEPSPNELSAIDDTSFEQPSPVVRPRVNALIEASPMKFAAASESPVGNRPAEVGQQVANAPLEVDAPLEFEPMQAVETIRQSPTKPAPTLPAEPALAPVYQKVRGRIVAIDVKTGTIGVQLLDEDSLPSGSKIRVYHRTEGSEEAVAIELRVVDSQDGIATAHLTGAAELSSIGLGDRAIAWMVFDGE